MQQNSDRSLPIELTNKCMQHAHLSELISCWRFIDSAALLLRVLSLVIEMGSGMRIEQAVKLVHFISRNRFPFVLIMLDRTRSTLTHEKLNNALWERRNRSGETVGPNNI